MPTYLYYARNATGKAMNGRRLAQSADTLSEQLIKEGLTPINITLLEDKENPFERLIDWVQGRKVTLEELGIFSRQMYTLVKAGVPLTTALKQLAENSRSIRMATALSGLVEHLESGQNLAAGMQDYPKIFTPLMVSMVRVGQNSGKLEEAFLHLNRYIEMEAGTLKRVKTALRYPTFILIAIIAAVIIVNIFVIPTFSKVFAQANLSLPKSTQILIIISDFFRDYWWIMLLIIAIAIGSMIHYLKTPEGKMVWDKNILRIPYLGNISRRIILLRFSQSFSLVVSSGIPIIEGLELVSQTLGNEFAKKEVLSIKDSVQRGKNLTQSVAGADLFTLLELQMLSVSEETGELSAMLDHLSSFYQREVDYDLKRLSDIIEPIAVICLALVVLMLAFSVYLPIWNMVKMVH